MHDAGNLAHDGHNRAMFMKGAQQRQRIEAERVISGNGPRDIVSVVMAEPAPLPAGGRLAQTAHSLFQPPNCLIPSITLQHPSMLPPICRHPLTGIDRLVLSGVMDWR